VPIQIPKAKVVRGVDGGLEEGGILEFDDGGIGRSSPNKRIGLL
jgi:hypothetical protein